MNILIAALVAYAIVAVFHVCFFSWFNNKIPEKSRLSGKTLIFTSIFWPAFYIIVGMAEKKKTHEDDDDYEDY